MKSFTDSTQRKWNIVITIGSVMKVKNKLGVDLFKLQDGEPQLIDRLVIDQLFLGEVICALIEDQFVKEGVDERDIINSFDGRTIDEARQAFFDELYYFFTEVRRPDNARLVRMADVILQQAIKTSVEKLDEMEQEILEKKDKIKELMFGDTSSEQQDT